MIRQIFRVGALLVLCALLVYAPELIASVRAPYGVITPDRILLRIALCTSDSDAASAFLKEVSSYQKEHSSVHLRVTRVQADQISQLPDPQPDLVVFSAGDVQSPQALLAPLRSEEGLDDPNQGIWAGMRYAVPFRTDGGQTLLCAACAKAREREEAQAFLSHLLGET